jgi:hypothetical protein
LLPILGKQSQPFDQIHPAGRQHPLLHDRVCGREIGWRHHVEQLAHDEAHNHFMVRRYPGIVARRRVEPLLAQQESLLVQPERQPLPFGRIEAMVLRQGFDAPTRFGILRGSAHGVIAEPLPFARRLGHQQQLPPRRAGQMQRPIGKCNTKRVGRDAIGHLRHQRADRPVHQLRHPFDRIGAGQCFGTGRRRAGCIAAHRKTAVHGRMATFTTPSRWCANRS